MTLYHLNFYKIMRTKLLFFILFFQATVSLCQNSVKRSQIYIRDPYILPDAKSGNYYMYSSSYDYKGMPGKRMGVTVYKSKDLENWTGPFKVFETGNGFWADTTHGCWAPEVHEYKGNYFLFTTFTNRSVQLKHQLKNRPDSAVVRRATVVLKSNSPEGPFWPVSSKAETPPEWMALDGTLLMEDGKTYMVFCREWIQVKDGTLEMAQLKSDLSGLLTKPTTLFKATAAPWVTALDLHGGGFVTDGPAFYKNKKGQLLMLWSSFAKNGYAVGQAVSTSGKLKGAWKQIAAPLFDGDGGHPSLFKTFDGKLMMSIHQPNKGNIRCHLFELSENKNGLLQIQSELPIDAKPLAYEKEGYVEMEAEDFAVQTKDETRKWHLQTNDSASGKKYMMILPDTRKTHGDSLYNGINFSNKAGEMAVLTYNINFASTGRYYVWVRAMSTGSEDNSVHVGLNGNWPETGLRMQWCQGKNKWWWESKQRTQKEHCGVPYQIYLDIEKPGLHTIQFSMREDGFRMDKFLLTTNREFKPKNQTN
jgi:GH43 family beta-xylosidase